MAFSFDELTKKAKDMAAVAADKAKDAAELAKVNVAIAGEQREMDKNYRTIGEWFVSEYEGEIPDAVRDVVEAVNASKAKIAELDPRGREGLPHLRRRQRQQILPPLRGAHGVIPVHHTPTKDTRRPERAAGVSFVR